MVRERPRECNVEPKTVAVRSISDRILINFLFAVKSDFRLFLQYRPSMIETYQTRQNVSILPALCLARAREV